MLRPPIFLLTFTLFTYASSLNAARYGIIVGLDEYQSPGNTLFSCVNDANGIRDELLSDTTRWSSATMTTYLNSAGTKAAVRAKIADIAAQAVSGDVVIFYQSSHGLQISGTSACLMMYDSSPFNISSMYQDTEFAADISAFESGVTLIVFIDACFSAGMYKSVGSDNSTVWNFAINAMNAMTDIREKSAAPITKAPSVGWITSSDYDETSWAGNPYSLFTGYAIDAFVSGDANSDGHLTFLEIFNYARPLTLADNPDQTAQKLNDAVLATIATSIVGPEDIYEPDDSFGTAKTIAPGFSQSRSIHSTTDIDYVRFTLTVEANVTLQTSGAFGDDTLMTLYNGVQTEIDFDDDGGEDWFSMINRTLAAGTYYIKIESYDNAVIDNYILLVAINESDSFEPDDTISSARYIAPNATQRHSLFPSGDSDYIAFTTSIETAVQIDVSAASGDVYLRLYDLSGTVIYYGDNGGSGASASIAETLPAGTYFIRVEDFYDAVVSQYDLIVRMPQISRTTTYRSKSNCGLERESNRRTLPAVALVFVLLAVGFSRTSRRVI
ncbi:MAG: DVUA0089 family protein [Planctomycetota bacterium]